MLSRRSSREALGASKFVAIDSHDPADFVHKQLQETAAPGFCVRLCRYDHFRG